MSMNQEQRFAFNVYEVLTQLFDADSENYQYDLNNIDLTKFFTGLLLASSMFYGKITKDDGDLLDFINVQTRLAFQYISAKQKEG